MIGKGITVGRWSIPESELEERFDTTGGPGGQHANRTRSGVTLRLDIAACSLPDPVKKRLTEKLGQHAETTSGESRSQWRNRALARQRLEAVIESALRETRQRKPTKPSRTAREQRLAGKRATAEKKRLRRRPGIDD